MSITAARPETCPRPGCDSTVSYSSAEQLRGGAALWQCESDHHGPRFVGFDGYDH